MNTSDTKRPTLLTVLCILSFIGGLYGLWEGYRSAFTDAPQRELEKARTQMQETIDQVGADHAMAGMMEEMIATTEKNVEQAKPMGYANIALSLLSLAGVWLMWNLKRMGFWLYLAASIRAIGS